MDIAQKLDNASDFIFAYRFKGKTDHWKRFVAFQKDFFLGGIIKGPDATKKPAAVDDDFGHHDDIGTQMLLGIVGISAVAIAVSALVYKDKPPYEYEDSDRKITVYPEEKIVVQVSDKKGFVSADFAKQSFCSGAMLKDSSKDSYYAVPSYCAPFNKIASPDDRATIDNLAQHLAKGHERYLKLSAKK